MGTSLPCYPWLCASGHEPHPYLRAPPRVPRTSLLPELPLARVAQGGQAPFPPQTLPFQLFSFQDSPGGGKATFWVQFPRKDRSPDGGRSLPSTQGPQGAEWALLADDKSHGCLWPQRLSGPSLGKRLPSTGEQDNDVPTLSLRTHDDGTFIVKGTANRIKSRASRCDPRVPKCGGRWRFGSQCWLRRQKRPPAKGRGCPSEGGKDKGTDCPLAAPERMQLCQHPDWSLVRSI